MKWMIIFVVLIIGCERKYTLEESKQIQFIKNLITDINKNVDKQKALLELINKEKDISNLVYWKIQFNSSIDEYYNKKKNINNEMEIIKNADISYEFEKIDSSFSKIEY